MNRKPHPPTRRGIGKRLMAALLASSALPAQPPEPQADDLSVAREANRRNSRLLLETKVPAAAEPSFRFEP